MLAVAVAFGLVLTSLSVWGIWQLPAEPQGQSQVTDPLARAKQATQPPAQSVEVASEEILVRRGDAVRERDEAKFLVDLDPTNATLRTQQEAIFRGLMKLPFNDFQYYFPNNATLPQADRTTYGVPALIKPVIAGYQLAGYDTGAVAEGQSVTFVLRRGRWWIGSDRDDQADLPVGGHSEPWDDGEVGVAHGVHCLVIGAVADQATLTRVAKAVDQAVAADIKFWPVRHGLSHPDRWDGKVVVYVPGAQREFNSQFSGSETVDGVAAITERVWNRVDFEKGGYGYGFVSGSRVIINPKYFKPSSSYFNVILRHEVSHVAAEGITASGTPTWFVEGLAEYVGWRQAADPSRTFFVRGVDGRTAAAMNAGDFRLTLTASRKFYDGSSATIGARYTAGFLVCAYIQHRYGESALKTFAQQLGAASTTKKGPAVLAAALHRNFGLDETGLINAVDSWLRQYRVGKR